MSTRDLIMKSIISYIEKHQYAPTVREIGDMVGLKSTSTVHIHLKELFAEGKLETDEVSSPRALRVPGYNFVKEEENE